MEIELDVAKCGTEKRSVKYLLGEVIQFSQVSRTTAFVERMLNENRSGHEESCGKPVGFPFNSTSGKERSSSATPVTRNQIVTMIGEEEVTKLMGQAEANATYWALFGGLSIEEIEPASVTAYAIFDAGVKAMTVVARS
ncbi:hypothetical protein AYO40_00560 [Planctomycetaceae bacterium SCGC AG-212-D15]|nr:hypothetical protein AYO40_00560 [Planctomycetaceae bacterium SCGC AG-212-D15]